MIFDVCKTFFFFFGPGIFLEYVEKCYTLAVDFMQTVCSVPQDVSIKKQLAN